MPNKCIAYGMGFPSQIADAPVLQLLSVMVLAEMYDFMYNQNVLMLCWR